MQEEHIFALEVEGSTHSTGSPVDHCSLLDGANFEDTVKDSRKRSLLRVEPGVEGTPNKAVNMSSSLPIAIPTLANVRLDTEQSDPPETFIPPHQLSHKIALDHQRTSGDVPVTTNANLRWRNRIFASTGFLPYNSLPSVVGLSRTLPPHVHNEERRSITLYDASSDSEQQPFMHATEAVHGILCFPSKHTRATAAQRMDKVPGYPLRT